MEQNNSATNGATRVAVALGQQPGDARGALPSLVASGRGALAEQILSLAFAAGVRVREDPDLAQLLATLDLDTPIPPEACVAVAEILGKVYEANKTLMDASSAQ